MSSHGIRLRNIEQTKLSTQVTNFTVVRILSTVLRVILIRVCPQGIVMASSDGHPTWCGETIEWEGVLVNMPLEESIIMETETCLCMGDNGVVDSD